MVITTQCQHSHDSAQESSLLQLPNLICAHLHRWSQAVVGLLSEAVGDEQAGLKFLIQLPICCLPLLLLFLAFLILAS